MLDDAGRALSFAALARHVAAAASLRCFDYLLA